MTAAVYRGGTPLMSVPHTQNTAPVLEFNCLYTHDVRRKTKRWQDGFLRYHTFNKRVMVYDVPRNFIGDTHWTADEALQDGDEVKLEKDGVMVQVADAVGKTETDLTELRKSAKKGSSERGSSPPPRGPQTPIVRRSNAATSKAPTQLKHRSLNALLGAPKGPLGKAALPTKSPFEIKHRDAENEEWEQGRPPKRQRVDDTPGRINVRTGGNAKTVAHKQPPLWARTSDAAVQRQKASLGADEVVDLCQDEPEHEKFLPGLSSDALAPASSPLKRSSSPAFQTQKARTKQSEGQQGQQHEKVVAPIRAPHKSISDAPVRRAQQSPSARAKAMSPAKSRAVPTKPVGTPHDTSKSGSAMRFASHALKKTLLCQEQLASKPKRISSSNTDAAAERLLGAASDSEDDTQPRVKGKTQRQLLEERLARINGKQTKPKIDAAPQIEKTGHTTNNQRADMTELDDRPIDGQNPNPAPHADELAQLDSMLLQSRDDGQVQEHSVTRRNKEHATDSDDGMEAAVSKPAPLRKKKGGVGRLDIRESAMSCFRAEKPDENKDDIQEAAVRSEKDRPQTVTMDVLPPAREETASRRVLSETNDITKPKRMPGAPMRFTPSPRKQQSAAALMPKSTKAPPSKPIPPPRQPKKAIQRAVGLNTAANGTAAVMLGRPFQAPKPASEVKEVVQMDVAAKADPWSREAFDLFEWRPPGWDEERWCFKDMAEALDAAGG